MTNRISQIVFLLASLLGAALAAPSFANVPGGGTGTGANVTVTDNGGTVVLANGIVSITINKSNGNITNFTYGGRNLLSGGNGGGSFYFDGSGGPTLNAPTYTLTVNPANNGGNQAEVFLQTIASPMDMGIYYDLLRGQQGIYDTFVLTHEASYPAYAGAELRTNMYVGSIFDFICVDPYRFRQMASPSDGTTAVAGAPKEVMLFTSGIYNGTTGCKYSYSDPLGDLNAYGWSSTTTNFGVWQTFPSHEYLDGGPMHRELTAHLGNTLLDMVGGGHYGFGLSQNIPAGTFASKTFGPAFIYANQYTGSSSDPVSLKARTLFADAQAQAAAEQSAWPYTWFNPQPVSGGSGTVYPQASGRGTVSGTFAINDAFNPGASPVSMWIGLAPVDGGTDFQAQYFTSQFWVRTGAGGAFTIPNVLPGTYNLWAFGPGAAGTFEQANVTVAAGAALNLGTVTWAPIRRGPTVWEIGTPDRNSNEFHNGEHDVTPYSGNLPWYAGGAPYDSTTAWGAFLAYATQFPGGVNYTVGSSNYADDWNFCQPTTLSGSSYVGTASKINFNLATAPSAAQTARLYLAFACNSGAACILTVNGTVQTGTVMTSTNGTYAATTNPSTGFALPDNNFDTMTRLGSQGTWGDAYLDFPATSLKAGTNTITVGMRPTGTAGSGSGFEYDYVRLEMSGFSSTGSPTPTKANTPAPSNTFTAIRTNTPVPPTNTSTFTNTRTNTPSSTATPTATLTASPTFTPVRTNTPTNTNTNTVVPPTSTLTNTRTNTPTMTATNTPSLTTVPPTVTFTNTNTPVPPTSTFTRTLTPSPTSTNSPIPPTATFTNTSVPPTSTPTSTNSPVLPTPTMTPTSVPPTATNSNTPVPPTATFTDTDSPIPPTVTDTNSPAPPTSTFTNTQTVTPTNSSTATPVPPTATPTPTATDTPRPPTSTMTATAVPPTVTPTSTRSNTAVPTATSTPTAVPPTSTFTRTSTSTNTAVPPTNTPTNSSTFTATLTRTLVPTNTPTASPTATSTPVPTATFTPVAPSNSFKVQLLSGVTSTTTNSPHPQIQVVNTGTGPLNLNNVTVRYWFNCDCTTQTERAWVDWAGLMPAGTTATGNVQISVQTTSLGGQTNYVLYNFTGNIVLQPGQAIQVQSRFNKSDWSNMTQSNDWSFSPFASFTDWSQVTGYLNGSLVWGMEPVSAPAALTVTSAVAFPNPSTGNGTTLSFVLNGSQTGPTGSLLDSNHPLLLDPSAKITLRIYTTNWRLIWTQNLTGGTYGTTGEHEFYWNEKDLWNAGLSNGLYILRVTVESHGQKSSATAKILILG